MVESKFQGISVIIPSRDGSRDGNVPRLVEEIRRQTLEPDEIRIVKGEFPCSRAHNVCVKIAKYDMIVFFDDDVRLSDDHVIEKLVCPIIEDSSIGISGASQRIPKISNTFQRRYAAQIDRVESEIVDKIVDSDMATHAGMAILKNVFWEVGGENENLKRGDDPEFRHRIRKAGYRIVIAPNTWVYHPPPKKLSLAVKSSFINGMGAAHDYLFDPDLIIEVPNGHVEDFVPKRSFKYRALRAVYKVAESIIYGKEILFLTNLSYHLGYFSGLIYYWKTLKEQNT